MTASGSDDPRGRQVGWLLHLTRRSARLSLRELEAALGHLGVRASYPTLSRWERTGTADHRVIAAYETALGLTPGLLQAATAAARRGTGPHPGVEPRRRLTLGEFSAWVDGSAESPEGHQWLNYAQAHEPSSGFGLPLHQMAPQLRRLVDELPRSTGAALVIRREALTRLRRTEYGDLLVEVARDAVSAPYSPPLAPLADAIAARVDQAAVSWLSLCLEKDATRVAAALRVVAHWRSAGELDRVLATHPDLRGSLRQAASEHAHLPAVRCELDQIRGRSRPSITPSRASTRSARVATSASHRGGSAGPPSPQWASRVADTACLRVGLAEQPPLPPLISDLLGDRAPEATLAATILTGTPLAAAVREVLAEHWEGGAAATPEIRLALGRAANALQTAGAPSLGQCGPTRTAGDEPDESAALHAVRLRSVALGIDADSPALQTADCGHPHLVEESHFACGMVGSGAGGRGRRRRHSGDQAPTCASHRASTDWWSDRAALCA